MPSFSQRSLERLATCDPRLQEILTKAIEIYDFTILQGHRSKEEQDKAFAEGRSKVKWPNSKHNTYPSKAVDIAPWFSEQPHIRWDDRESFVYLAGIIKGIAHSLGYTIRWGGDWDRDNDLKDQTFNDLPHFELVD